MSTSRRRFLASAAAGVAACATAGVLARRARAAPADARPNVLFLLTDDQRPDALGAFGNRHVRTPNLDALAGRGMALRDAYCQGAFQGAVCVPSRVMLLTGTSLFHLPSGRKEATNLTPAQFPTTFARTMKEAGYATLRTGKQGSTAPKMYGDFDQDITVKRADTCGATHVDNAARFIREHAGKKPFFAYVEFAAPHDPQPAPPEYYQMFRAQDLPLPESFLPQHPFDNGEMAIRDEQTLPWPRTRESVTGKLARYYASLAYTDAQIGRLLQVLQDTGQASNTVVVFASDNGLSLGEHGLLGKQNLYEFGGMHVPLIFAGPGIGPGQSHALAYLYDIFPTVCDLVGLPAPQRIDGRSLAPVLRGTAGAGRDHVLCAYRDVQRSFRDERWKLIRYPQINRSQLFDLQSDPREMNDLAPSPAHAAKLQQMLTRLAQAQKDAGDTCPLTVDNPKPADWSPPKPKGSADAGRTPEPARA